MLEAKARADSRYRFVKLSRNFGHQIAITTGMERASGEAVIVMDADLQDPPEVVLEMIAKWREGFEVVYAQRLSRDGESRFKRLTASLFYRLLGHLSEVEIPRDVGDFRLVDRKALDGFLVDAGTRSFRARHVRLDRVPARSRAIPSSGARGRRDEIFAGENASAGGAAAWFRSPTRRCAWRCGWASSFARCRGGLRALRRRPMGDQRRSDARLEFDHPASSRSSAAPTC